jgi:hypothetical protein
MSIFNWFSRHPQTKAAPEEQNRPVASQKKSAAFQESDGDQRSDHSKARHLRRDQVFVAIREAMTRTGILSTNYKFKVLSEDTQGKDFLVMMSLVTTAGEPFPDLTEMEASIMDSAKVRYDIVVSAVYWRITEVAAAAKFVPPPTAAVRAAAQPVHPAHPTQPAKPKSAHETIEAGEVLAFQQALLAASAQSEPSEKGPRRKPQPRAPNRMRDFQDTEMSESTTPAVVSKTQYGELN